MDPNLPIQVEPTDDGVRIVFPRWKLGPSGWLPFFLILLSSSIIAGLLAYAAYRLLGRPAGLGDLGTGGRIIAGVAALMIAAHAYACVRGFIVMVAGHSEIALTGRQVRVVDRAGPFRRVRSCPLGATHKVWVERAVGQADDEPATLKIKVEGRPAMTLAMFYPAPWLEAARAALEPRLARVTADSPRPTAAGLTVSESGGGPVYSLPRKAGEAPQRPATSGRVGIGPWINVRREGATSTVEFRPPGARVLACFLLAWGLLWVVGAGVAGLDAFGPDELSYAMLIPVWVLAGAFLILAIRLWRVRDILEVDARIVTLRRTTASGTKSTAWSRGEVAGVRVGEARVWGSCIPQLQLELRGGRTVGIWNIRHRGDLERAANFVREALGLGGQE